MYELLTASKTGSRHRLSSHSTKLDEHGIQASGRGYQIAEVSQRLRLARPSAEAIRTTDSVLAGSGHPKTIRHTVATLLYADETVPVREIAEMPGHEGQLARTVRIYAKYDPARLRSLCRALTRLWLQISREARAFSADRWPKG